MEAELKGHNNWVRDVAWAPDTGFTTSTIASCCQDGKVFIWQCKDLDKANWDIKVRSHKIGNFSDSRTYVLRSSIVIKVYKLTI